MSHTIINNLEQIVMEGIKDMVFVMGVNTDHDFVYELVNRTAREQTGITEKDLGKTIQDVMPQDVAHELYKHYNTVLSTREKVTYEDVYLTSADEKHFSETALTPLFDDEGRLHLIVAVIKDVTNVKLAELEKNKTWNQLEDNLKRFRIIAEHAQDMITLLDKSGTVKYASPSCAQILGLDHQAYAERSFLYNVHPDDQNRVGAAITQAVRHAESFTLQFRNYTSDNEIVWLESRGTPVFDYQKNFRDLVVVTRDISLQKEHEAELEYFALHDPLTGLPNRRFFMERLSQTLDQLDGKDEGLAVIMMDVDYFKNINDEYGHDIGDEVIIEFGRRVSGAVHGDGMVARLGGDEFITLLPGIESREQAVLAAESIQAAMHRRWDVNGYAMEVTASMGIAMASTQVETTFSILKSADMALYEAKRSGRNTYQLGS